MTASPPDNEAIFHAARRHPRPGPPAGVRPGGVRRRRGPDRPHRGAAGGRRRPRQPAGPSGGGHSRGDHRPAYHGEPRHGDRPVQAHRADRRGRHGQRLDGPADRAGQAARRRQADQGRHGLPAGHRPLRGRAAGAGPDGPPQHRPRAGRRHHQRWPAVLRHGSRQGGAHHPLLRRAPPHAAAAAGTVHPGLPGGAARASEGHHPPRPQALQRAGRPL